MADYFVITNDDAYPEPPEVIADAIEAGRARGGSGGGAQYERCLDGLGAIPGAARRARPGDVVLLAGKGHEAFLHVEAIAEPWSDVTVAEALRRRWGIEAESQLRCADAARARRREISRWLVFRR